MLLAELHAVTKMFAVHHTCIPNEHKFDSVLPGFVHGYMVAKFGSCLKNMLHQLMLL